MAAKRKRHQKKKETGLDQAMSGLISHMKEAGLYHEDQELSLTDEGPKISAVFLDYIEHFREFAPTDEAFRKLIVIGIIAWNTAILPKSERKETVDGVLDSIYSMAGQEAVEDAEAVLEMLIKHKERYFADDRRFIVDYQLVEMDDGYYLTMASLMTK